MAAEFDLRAESAATRAEEAAMQRRAMGVQIIRHTNVRKPTELLSIICVRQGKSASAYGMRIKGQAMNGFLKCGGMTDRFHARRSVPFAPETWLLPPAEPVPQPPKRRRVECFRLTSEQAKDLADT